MRGSVAGAGAVRKKTILFSVDHINDAVYINGIVYGGKSMSTQAAQNGLSGEALVFLRRALPHFMAGKSVEDSMRAVLDDDARILTAAFARSTTDYFPTPCESGRTVVHADRTGDLIASEIAATVHARFNTQAAA
jgi:hypothetical protein